MPVKIRLETKGVCVVPRQHICVTVNPRGAHPEYVAIPEDGLGPPLIFDRIKKSWLNFHNERINGRLGFRFYDDLEGCAGYRSAE